MSKFIPTAICTISMFHQTYVFIRHIYFCGDTDILPTIHSQVGVGAGLEGV